MLKGKPTKTIWSVGFDASVKPKQFLIFLFLFICYWDGFNQYQESHLVNPTSPYLIDGYGLCRPLCSLHPRIQKFWTKQTIYCTECFAFLKALPVVRLALCPEDDARGNLIESFQSKQLMIHSKFIGSLLLHRIMHKIITLHKITLCFAKIAIFPENSWSVQSGKCSSSEEHESPQQISIRKQQNRWFVKTFQNNAYTHVSSSHK